MGPRHRRGRRSDAQAVVLVIAGPTISQIRAGLVAAAEPVPSTAVHARAFRAWLLDEQERLAGLSGDAASNLGAGGGRSAGHVAVLGYVDAAGRLEHQFLPVLAAGLAWLGDRAWFRPHQPPTLEADGVAALGIALGVHRRGMIPQAGWLQELVVRSARSPDLSPLERSFFIAAAHLIDAPGHQDAAAMLPEARLAFAPLGFGAADETCCREAWQRTLRFAGGGEVIPESALAAAGARCADRAQPAGAPGPARSARCPSCVGGGAAFVQTLDPGRSLPGRPNRPSRAGMLKTSTTSRTCCGRCWRPCFLT